MQTKLTLRMDEQLISEAKRIAQSRGKPLSHLVADYFRLLKLESHGDKATPILSPTSWTKSLLGIAKPDVGRSSDTDQLRLAYLAEKYQLLLESLDENPV
ncbi:MAG: DUF6364 family protein [Caldilineaceae bacterium]